MGGIRSFIASMMASAIGISNTKSRRAKINNKIDLPKSAEKNDAVKPYALPMK